MDGTGSAWTNNGDFRVGFAGGNGTLNITNGGLVSVAGTLTIDYDGYSDSIINIASGGKLAIYGDPDDSLVSFLGLIDDTQATNPTRYWNEAFSTWDSITNATPGVDYTLTYLAVGDLAGYTVLTVTTVPEPAMLILIAAGLPALLRLRRHRS